MINLNYFSKFFVRKDESLSRTDLKITNHKYTKLSFSLVFIYLGITGTAPILTVSPLPFIGGGVTSWGSSMTVPFITLPWLVWRNPDVNSSDWLVAARGNNFCRLLCEHLFLLLSRMGFTSRLICEIQTPSYFMGRSSLCFLSLFSFLCSEVLNTSSIWDFEGMCEIVRLKILTTSLIMYSKIYWSHTLQEIRHLLVLK